MSVRKSINFLLLIIVLLSLFGFTFNHYIDIYEEVGQSTYGKIIKFERNDNGNGSNYISLEIETDEGEVLKYEKAKGAHYNLGARIQVHEYRRKYTGRRHFVFRE